MSDPSRLTTYGKQWDVALEHQWETSTSLLAAGLRRGDAVVIKVSKSPADEWYSGDVLRAFAGEGVVKVYEAVPGAVLLEKLDPGHDLVEPVRQGNDDLATEIMADVIRRLAHHSPLTTCPTVFDWSRGFDRYLSSPEGKAGPISLELTSYARDLYKRLAASQTNTRLLHGDLQHYNVLFDSRRGWLAIDPKGVVGELEYEVGAMMRNPVELPEVFTSIDVILRRLNILTNKLKLNYERALHWTFAQSVLSAIWDIEDGHRVDANHHALKLARVLQQMVS